MTRSIHYQISFDLERLVDFSEHFIQRHRVRGYTYVLINRLC